MPSTLSTQKRACNDWTSLPFNVVGSLGERLLAADDIDCYMAFRAVCEDWRSATKDYPEKADYTDPTCFQPGKWALLDQQDDLVTLVNVDTGRFLCKSIPILRKYFFVGATGGGLILLRESMEPHHARVLNPFTGSIAYFKVSIPVVGLMAIAVTTGPLMIFVSTEIGDIMWVDQNSECFKRFSLTYPNQPTCITSFTSNVYATDRLGSIFSMIVADVAAGEQKAPSALTSSAIPSLDTGHLALIRSGRYYLVESGGDLLLVTRPSHMIPVHPVVHRVDIKEKILEPVINIGNHAIFVSPIRCLSVDADKFQGIKGGCVYFVEPILTRGNYVPSTMITFSIADGWQGLHMFEQGTLEGCFRPLTLAQVFADYCRTTHHSELHQMISSEWDWNFSDNEPDE
ncbi:hypothetical protein BAE44_0005025 [Dichanthelium oligosanthes]|uniref:KIB1-4 beta-propeller domain-containing protein n=1 Tax=Dichanthelium oligosanthes TaxID=888268 RepID=A0A1E5W957_9POAL|nr:hypothetical protein BAE44_0005025 [Dichanthelium oligosanthes]